MTKTWLITGCSSGLGKALAIAVLERGDRLVATARNAGDLDELVARYPDAVRAVAVDVTKAGDAAAAFGVAQDVFGGLDVLVNNAGFGFVGAVEESEPAEYRPVFETNVFGLIETTRAALPLMRKTGGGRIVNLSSGAGIAGGAGSGFYSASKFAVEGFSEALAQELAPFGIRVVIVEPGPLRTDFLGRSINAAEREMPEYADTAGRFRTYRTGNDGKQAGGPDKAAIIMLKAVDAHEPPLHLPLGERAYAMVHGKFDAFLKDMDTWKADALATGY